MGESFTREEINQAPGPAASGTGSQEDRARRRRASSATLRPHSSHPLAHSPQVTRGPRVWPPAENIVLKRIKQ